MHPEAKIHKSRFWSTEYQEITVKHYWWSKQISLKRKIVAHIL